MKPSESFQREIETAASDWIARRDAGLTAAEATAFARWQAADARHAEALARHERTWTVFDRQLTDDAARAMAGRLRIRAQRRRRQATVAVGFAAVLAVTIASYFRPDARRPFDSVARPAASLARLAPPKYQMLADGSRVDFKDDAEITVDFSGQLRRVTLRRGEAHFQVAENKMKPFIVAAAGVEVRAVGTAFSVGMEAKQVEVLVTEGRVSVAPPVAPTLSSPDTPAPVPSSFVDAGNRVVVELATPSAPLPVMPVPANELAERMAWRNPRLEFTGTPLAEAVQLINRYNRVQFVIGDPAIASLEVSGYFRADNVATFETLIEQTLDVKAERQGETITLRRAR